ncbi:histidine--tRNA ligase [bacterium]|nr:histidine--tRNA ligase [bacterium]
MAKQIYQRPRGTHDILPADWRYWQFMQSTFIDICTAAGYGRISTPTIESTELFVRSVGDTTEIVGKEMYNFEDRSGNPLSLKPESTAGVARAYIENGLSSQPKPVRLYYLEPAFRYERPQAGRFRQHHQAGVEVFGSTEPLIDAQVIKLMARFYTRLGIKFNLLINTLGDPDDRRAYSQALVDYFTEHREHLSELNLRQLETNPLRILDSKDPALTKLIDAAPQILDFLSEDAQAHFRAVLEYLDEFGVEYEISAKLVRGLDYYTRTVFEFKGTHQGMQDTIGAGGRYDGLVAELGGQPTPGIGFGIGLERVELELKQAKIEPPELGVAVTGISLAPKAAFATAKLIESMLDQGVSAQMIVSTAGLTEQLAKASKLGAKVAVIIGQQELTKKQVIIKDLVSGTQQSVKYAEAHTVIADLLDLGIEK